MTECSHGGRHWPAGVTGYSWDAMYEDRVVRGHVQVCRCGATRRVEEAMTLDYEQRSDVGPWVVKVAGPQPDDTIH